MSNDRCQQQTTIEGDMTMFRSLLPALLLTIFVTGCGGSTDSTSSTGEKTEVVIVGTQHFITDMPDGYTPGHLRAMLAKIKPDVIAIEAATNVEKPMSTAPHECAQVTAPWAMSHDIPVAAVGILEPDYQQQNVRMVEKFKAEGKLAAYEQAERKLADGIATVGASCRAMNGSRFQKIWREYHSELHRLNGGDTPWEIWNARVVRKIRKLCKDNPGKRIAVVFGGTHSYLFKDLLAKQSDISLVSVDAFARVSQMDLQQNTEPLDYLKAMRPLNFDLVQPAQLAHVRSLLDFLKGVPSLENDYLLFHGKYLMHSGDYSDAIAAFDRLARSAGDQISEFDGQNRIIDGARLSAAQAFVKADQSENARKLLQRIIADTGSSNDVRSYAQQMLSAISKTQTERRQASIR